MSKVEHIKVEHAYHDVIEQFGYVKELGLIDSLTDHRGMMPGIRKRVREQKAVL